MENPNQTQTHNPIKRLEEMIHDAEHEAYEGGESQGLPLTLMAIFLMCIIAAAVLLTIYFTVGTGAITTTLGNYPQR